MILIYVLLFWCLPGLYIARLERNSFHYWWFNEFKSEYWEDYGKGIDNGTYVIGFIGGWFSIIIGGFIMEYYNPKSRYYLSRSKWRWKYSH